MRTFFSRFFFVLMMQLLVTPTFLMVPRESLLLWAGAYLILFFLFILLSFATVRGKKHRLLVANTALELKKLLDLEEKVALGAKKITLECPACQKKHTAWDYMKDKACPSCRSTLWSTAETDNPVDFQKVLKDWEKIQAFYDNTPAWALKSAQEKVILDKA
jgi:hypothetical protein